MKKIIATLFFFSLPLYAQDLTNEDGLAKGNVKIIYEKRQKVDLEDISIQGEFITPGDFSIEDNNYNASKMLYRRKNYNDRLPMIIEYVY